MTGISVTGTPAIEVLHTLRVYIEGPLSTPVTPTGTKSSDPTNAASKINPDTFIEET
ncbi:MAG: hypothetical protein L7F77_01130 [Candidatus Magnetominusculus sp. LBB02]|nr:hypothetical protein [Candidatus Magnetominusculus sp. LBB02]